MNHPEKEYSFTVMIRCYTYNHEKYIKDALEGFVMQKTNFPFIAIIVDDASTDDTAKIIREYELKYPNIIKPYYLKENHYSQRKPKFPYFQSIQKKSKYIALCEGDDYWTDPLKLQKQVDFMEKNPEYSMCFHNAIIYETSSVKRNVFLFNNFISDRDLTIDDVVNKWVVPTASIMCRKEHLEFPDWMVRIYSGDYALLLSLFLKGKIKYIDIISSVYRKNLNGNSVSTNVNSNFVRNQHLLLLESYNEGTNKKYNSVISKRITHLKKEIALREAIWQHRYYKLIFLLPQLWNNRKKIFK
ncbi:glycosyltransferase [uncultured Draconibacterium sp.]|uniref:glycosyltransferase family 2 protein n=1 Tax=uncultured Draconibacterium sp. TaxID=1573823 RepID=UPI0029C64015|nr:glycosyltransferase [uncultured Draconibacterium sp.]